MITLLDLTQPFDGAILVLVAFGVFILCYLGGKENE